MRPVEFSCELLARYSFHKFLECFWLFYSNDMFQYIDPVYFGKITVKRAIIFWLGYIWHVMMFTLLCTDSNSSNYWWKINSDFKCIIFNEGLIWKINFNVGRVGIFVPVISSEPGDHNLPNILLYSSTFSYEQYLSFLVCGSQNFIVALILV